MARWRYILAVLVLLLGIIDCLATKTVGDEYMQKGMLHAMNVEYAEAYTCYRKASSYYHTEGNKEMELQALKNMAIYALWVGETDSCIIRQQQCVQIARELKDEYAEYDIYFNMYSTYYIKADMEHAMQMSLKMDSVATKSKDVRIKFDKLQKLAQEAANQRIPKLQEHYLLERERLLKNIPDDMWKSEKNTVYTELSSFYMSQQDFNTARKYNHLNIKSSTGKPNKEILDYMTYGNEAIVCACLKDRKSAFEALDSIKIGLEHCKEVSPVHWMSYYGITGNVYELFQDWTSAIDAYEKALNIVKGKELELGPLYHIYLIRLGVACNSAGEYNRACKYYQEYIEPRKRIVADIFEYAQALFILAQFEAAQGKIKKGCNHFMQATDVIIEELSKQLRYISAQERDSFWDIFSTNLWGMGYYALMAGEYQSLFTQKSYDALLFSKALLLESDRSMAAAINRECSKEEQRIFYEMVNLQKNIKDMTKDQEKNKEYIEEFHRRISSLDKKLTPIISRLGYTSFLDIDYTTIKNTLGVDEVIIDFSDFYGDVHQYAAYIVNKEQTYPKLIKAFTEENLTAILDGKPYDNLYKPSMADKVVKLLWTPFEEEVKHKKIIYYIPSGIMHQIALESLPMQDGTLLGEHFHFVRLTSAREIAKIKSTSSAGIQKQAIIYGDLRYDIDETTMTEEATHYKVDALYAMNKGEPTRGNGKWGELENGKEEVETICKLLIRKDVSVTPRTGVTGTEESFFAMSGHAPQMLHVSTHGFYYTPEKAKNVAFLNGYQDAMQLSGLILAGGNREWTGQTIPQGVMGGVLTANDIATLDLRGTDLVVLSACQTGLGVATSEGIYGLQRAFKKAGIQTIVMSLWNVSDRVTKEFMVKFYEELTGPAKWDKRKAFEEAKRHIRDSNKDHPYYWAAFVMLD